MLRAFMAALALAGCASTPTSDRSNAGIAQERREDSVKRMQDEFNALTGQI